MKKYLALFLSILIVLQSCFALADNSISPIRDDAKLFTNAEKDNIKQRIDRFCAETGMDFVVVTTDQNHGVTQQEFADGIYDEGGYGTGEDNSGILYYIDMYNRVPYISTAGKMIAHMTDGRIEAAHESCFDYLKNGLYGQAVLRMIEVVTQYVCQGIPEGQYQYIISDETAMNKNETMKRQNADTLFNFRNGVQWGMSQEKVKESETGVPENDEYNGYLRLMYKDEKVSNYSARLVYAFYENRLVNVFYAFDSLDEKDYSYLSAALSSKYGQPAAPSTERQKVLLNVLQGPKDEEELYHLTNWELADGTYLSLFYLDEACEEMCVLIYSDEMTLLDIGGIYNTFGL